MCLDVLDEQPKSKWQKLLRIHITIREFERRAKHTFFISLSWRPNETYRHEQSVNVAGRAKNGYRVKGIMSGSRK
ncbi:hypothetical protein KM043_012883 [Ampulex compressa]|nr:hypothetical protein KM043_012883 [Ampulex compressa]